MDFVLCIVNMPLFCDLLPNNTVESYKAAFMFITDKCNTLGCVLQPNTTVTDFEETIHKAAKAVRPNVRIVGCCFHLSQGWWRRFGSWVWPKNTQKLCDTEWVDSSGVSGFHFWI